MYKPSIAIVMTSLAAFSQQAAASDQINIETSKVSEELASVIQQTFNHVDPSAILEQCFQSFCENITVDGEKLSVDIESYFTSSDDSTNITKKTTKSNTASSNCYINCYNNCHGSRAWR